MSLDNSRFTRRFMTVVRNQLRSVYLALAASSALRRLVPESAKGLIRSGGLALQDSETREQNRILVLAQEHIAARKYNEAVTLLASLVVVASDNVNGREMLRSVLMATGLIVSDEPTVANLREIALRDHAFQGPVERVCRVMGGDLNEQVLTNLPTSELVLQASMLHGKRSRLIGPWLNELNRRPSDEVLPTLRSSSALHAPVVATASRFLSRLRQDPSLAADFAEVVAGDEALSVLQAIVEGDEEKGRPSAEDDGRSLFARSIVNYCSYGPSLYEHVPLAGDYLLERSGEAEASDSAKLEGALASNLSTIGVFAGTAFRSGFVNWKKTPADGAELWQDLARTHADDPTFAFHARQSRREAIPELPFVGFPRSGSVFVYTSLVEGLGKPGFGGVMGGAFPDFTVAQEGFIVQRAGRGSAHTHLRASETNLLEIGPRFGVEKMLVHIRDPRQALMSWHDFMPKIAGELDPVQAKHYGLPDTYLSMSADEQLEWLIEFWMPVLVTWLDEWKRATELPWFETKVYFSKFEDLKSDQSKFFEGILDFFEIEHDLFDAPAPPKSTGDRNFRQGYVESWRTELTIQQSQAVQDAISDDSLAFFGWKR